MTIYVDLGFEKIVESPGVGAFVRSIRFKRNLLAQLDVQFVDGDGVITELPPDATGVFGIKEKTKYDADYAVSDLAWVKTGTGEDTVYSFGFSFINPALDALFLVDGNPNNDVVQIAFMAELQWITGGNIFKSQTIEVLVENDVNREGDVAPELPIFAYGIYLPDITERTGGVEGALDFVPTITLITGYVVQCLIDTGAGFEWTAFILTEGDGDGIDGAVVPLDYDAMTNNRFWRGALGSAGSSALDPAGSTVLAAEDLPAFSVVTVGGNIADSNNTAHFSRVAGITIDDVASGFIATVELEGEITNPAWSWSPNDKLFLNGTSLSTSAPTTGFAQMVAIARTTETIMIRIGAPVLL